MKLTTITHVSLDGVMQGLGGAGEDRRGGFERGGWALPLFNNEAATFLDEVFTRAEGFLFGRRTYEIFASSWGTGSWGANQGDNPISVALNTKPKYVASTTLTDTGMPRRTLSVTTQKSSNCSRQRSWCGSSPRRSEIESTTSMPAMR